MIFRRGIRSFLPIAAAIALLTLPALATEVPDPLPDPDGKSADMSKPVQVYILMGQSNMLGFGKSSVLQGIAAEKYPLTPARGRYARTSATCLSCARATAPRRISKTTG